MDLSFIENIWQTVLRVAQANADMFAVGGGGILLLLIIRSIFRRARARKARQMREAMGAPVATTAADAPAFDAAEFGKSAEDGSLDATDDVTIDTLDEPLSEEDAALVVDLTDAADEDEAKAVAPEPDQLAEDNALMPQFNEEADVASMDSDNIEDITIPRVGEPPPKTKAGFFSGPWLQRDKAGDGSDLSQAMRAADDENNLTGPEAAEVARLAEIERKMLALRELYEAGLIAPEIYVIKAREFAEESRRG